VEHAEVVTAQDRPLRDLVALERTAADRFTGPTPDWAVARGRRFGGAALAQILRAAHLTVGDERAPHALHAFFVEAATGDEPFDLAVERLSDGGTFATRQVTATQAGRTRCVATVSFSRRRDGAEFAVPPPAGVPVPTPELAARSGGMTRISRTHVATPFEVLDVSDDVEGDVEGDVDGSGARPRRLLWFRAHERLGDEAGLQACALAYASDIGPMTAARTVVDATYETPGRFATLNHALWLHRTPRLDEWTLVDHRPQSAAQSRGLVTANVHSHDGELTATLTQEAMLRLGATPQPSTSGSP
jgi:acyl-CoA thioesterase-2